MGKPPHLAPYDGSTEHNRGGRPRHRDVLTPAEWRVLEALREGGTNAEIAARLDVSTNTVRYHVSNMLAKLELRDRRALAAWRPEGDRGRVGALLALPAAVWSVALSAGREDFIDEHAQFQRDVEVVLAILRVAADPGMRVVRLLRLMARLKLV